MSTTTANMTVQVLSLAVSETELAKLIGMSVFFLRKDRCTKRILPFYKIGDAVRYNPERVMQALAALEEGGSPKKTRGPNATGLKVIKKN